jgi:hypothetical protein
MPYTKRTNLYYPKKGSDEAYEWAIRMRKLKRKRKYQRNMIVQCAWCKKVLKKDKGDILKEEERNMKISHGICSKCSKKLIKESR